MNYMLRVILLVGAVELCNGLRGSDAPAPESPSSPKGVRLGVAGGAQAETKLQRPVDDCHFQAPRKGFIPGCAQGCQSFASLSEAKAACLELPDCGGLTSSGGAYQLRQSRLVEASPQRESSWVKECLPATPAPSAFGEHKVACNTTAGPFVITLQDSLSPLGVSRFLSLVDDDFFDDMLLYRVIPGFLTQFGVAASPKVQRKWNDRWFPDEPKRSRFEHGTVSYAGGGKNSRSCHIFIAFAPNGLSHGHADHETPLGRVTEGFDTLDKIQRNYKQAGYADLTHLQNDIRFNGNEAAAQYPLLDRIQHCQHMP